MRLAVHGRAMARSLQGASRTRTWGRGMRRSALGAHSGWRGTRAPAAVGVAGAALRLGHGAHGGWRGARFCFPFLVFGFFFLIYYQHHPLLKNSLQGRVMASPVPEDTISKDG
uniref:Uncharacterized protein n=1 Tax=Setaria viridis TaxID=4556 RepID=A0A4U6W015_SETVI|nr:hypothetical protein SEVIR_2G257550v2 [Setaria viridis]